MPPEPTASEVLPGFQALTFNPERCRQDLAAFEALLAGTPELREKADILPFFRAHPHLSLFLGSYDATLDRYDRLAYEFDLFGDFKPDIVIGDWGTKRYCFVEFEDAFVDSVFQKVARQTTVWAPRFERGFSQIIDWFWLLESNQDTERFEGKFGKRRIDASALLVVGRDSGVSGGDRLRLEWRRKNVVVNPQKVFCCTFDELLRGLKRKLTVYASIYAGEADGQANG